MLPSRNSDVESPMSSEKTRVELLEEMNLLKPLNDALLEEVKSNEETIANLEKKEKKAVQDIKNLQQKSGTTKPTSTNKGTQTHFNEIRICTECDYPADDLYDLGEHMGEDHTNKNVCEHCDESFDAQNRLVEHISKQHWVEQEEKSAKVKICCNFCDKIFEQKDEIMKHKEQNTQKK